jgi:signal transduction histidine kinase
VQAGQPVGERHDVRRLRRRRQVVSGGKARSSLAVWDASHAGKRTSPDVDEIYARRRMPPGFATRTVVVMHAIDRFRHSWVFDALIALTVSVAMVTITAQINPGNAERQPDLLCYLLVIGAGGAIALWRRAPIVGLGIVTVLLWVYSVREYAGGPVYLTFFILVFGVAVTNERRRSLVISAVALGVLLTSHLIVFGSEGVWPLLSIGWTAAAWFWGDGLRTRRAYLAGLEERARYLEETREEETRRRVADERLRIARDLHDVIAHSIASINVQAGSAIHVMDRRPEQARESLLAIKEASGEALSELRSTIGIMRGSEDGDAPRTPAPSLARLDPLLETAARAGIPVEVGVRGEQRPLPSAVDVAGYRIVQESLTNVVRHAHAHEATVTIEYQPASVEIEVIDDGRNGAGGGAPGHGIAGMRERAQAVGGQVEAGPRFSGGFRVWARLPAATEAG